MLRIPDAVKQDAREGQTLLDLGFKGGTKTGWERANQLINDDKIPLTDVAVMRAWFARHGPDAKNGGTSYPGYCEWINADKPLDEPLNHRGAVSWLIWGGDAAYTWLKTPSVRQALRKAFPSKKQASLRINLVC